MQDKHITLQYKDASTVLLSFVALPRDTCLIPFHAFASVYCTVLILLQ